MKGVGYMGMDFNVNVNVKTTGAEKIDVLESKIQSLKTQPINLKVNVDSKSLNVTSLGTQLQSSFANAGTSAGKSYNTALQTQINSMAKTQQTAFSQPLRNITKQQQSYINWWEKSLNKFSQLDATTASNKTLTWLKNNSKAAKDYSAVLTDLANKQRYATSPEELKNYTKQIQAIQAQAAALGKTGRSFGAEFKRATLQIGQFAGVYGGWQLVGNSIRESVSQLKEMDSILTEISKVSDMSQSQLNQLGKDAFDYASKYGKNVNDYLQGVTEMNRSGFYGQQGVDLANVSVLAQAAGDMTADVANSYLLATNAAYDYAGSAEKLNAVLDGQNMINTMVMPCRKLMAS